MEETMSKRKYPLFIPPAELAEKDSREWSAKEAKSYLYWLLGVHQERIDGLLKFFGETLTAAPEDDLVRLGEQVAEAIKTSDFSRLVSPIPKKRFDFSQVPTSRETISDFFRYISCIGPKLTDAGYALAADMGLLVAKFLLDECSDKVKWSIVRSPKSDVSYNLPVLIGFGKLQLDPIGGSIAQTYGLLRGNKKPTVWQEIFTIWKGEALQS
jgi:hypothetical protein